MNPFRFEDLRYIAAGVRFDSVGRGLRKGWGLVKGASTKPGNNKRGIQRRREAARLRAMTPLYPPLEGAVWASRLQHPASGGRVTLASSNASVPQPDPRFAVAKLKFLDRQGNAAIGQRFLYYGSIPYSIDCLDDVTLFYREGLPSIYTARHKAIVRHFTQEHSYERNDHNETRAA